ncbi:MAG: amino acid adenylation domain-containing protein [Clostridia bacterium]|nr:amino acid adenylation domain-containing protein [Clostridia bacterium]
MKMDKYSQNLILSSGKFDNEKNYWLDKLSGEITINTFPEDYSYTKDERGKKESISFCLPDTTSGKIISMSNNSDYGTFMVLLSGVMYLLHRYTGAEDIIIGSPVLKQKVKANYINELLLLRSKLIETITFKEFLLNIKQTVTEANNNQNYPMSKIDEALNLGVYRNDVPYVAAMAMLSNIHDIKLVEEVQAGMAFCFTITGTSIECVIQYDSGRYAEETVKQIYRHLESFLHTATHNTKSLLCEAGVLPPEDTRKLLYELNNTQEQYPSDKTIHQLFEEQAERTPESRAVIFGEKYLTYAELNMRANNVAAALRKEGVRKGSIVAVMMERSLELIGGILGILKAGGAYLPIDPEYPEKRVKAMLEDSHVDIMLTTEKTAKSIDFISLLPNGDGTGSDDEYTRNANKLKKVIMVDKILQDLSGKVEAVENVSGPQDLVYVIYTSGSTGKPKGVMLEHRNLVNLISFQYSKTNLEFSSKLLQFTTISFDVSFQEIFSTLLAGGELYLISSELRNDVEGLLDFIAQNNIKILSFPVAYIKLLFNSEKYIEKIPDCVTHMITAGEQLVVSEHMKKYLKENKVYLHNHYGPSETHVATTLTIDPLGEIPELPSIGRPISNTRVYILDENQRLQPVGVAGELYISGDCVGRGYLNNPELTSQRFMDDPFFTGEKMYKTGDIARWTVSGNIEFLGRKDHQVKIRGFRVETGEIEVHLMNYPSIKEAVVIARDGINGSKSLAAYLVSEEKLSLSSIREYLSEELPDYMVPSYLVQLDALPLTPNGKVDRKLLPEPDEKMAFSTEYIKPRNENEEKFAEFWQEVLRVEKVGINDNFFDLGGDSIKAIQIIAKTNQLGMNIAVKDILKHKTIAGIFENLKSSTKEVLANQGEISGEVLVTPIQKWFFQNEFGQQHYWNQTNMFMLNEDVDIKLLEDVFKKIIIYHDALRMTYKISSEEIKQFNRKNSEVEFKLDIINLSNYTYQVQQQKMIEIGKEIQDSLNLEGDLLIKGIVFDLGLNGKRLMVPIHHLVIDGVSWRIMLDDMEKLYRAKLQYDLPPKTTSFKDWAEKLYEYPQREYIDVEYWERINPSETRTLLETEMKDNYLKDFNVLDMSFNKEYTGILLKQANQAFDTSIDDVLMAALSISITKTFSVDKVLITLEGHGREEIMEEMDLSRTIGWFTTRYPVWFEKQESVEKTILYIKENLKCIPNKGLNYGIARYISRNERLKALEPEISFNYLGQLDGLVEKEHGSLLSYCPANEIVDISANPRNKHFSPIDISGAIINESLQLAIRYNEKYLKAENMNRFKECFEETLKFILNYCIEKVNQESSKATTKEDTLLNDEAGSEIKRTYNKSYTPYAQYPYYIDCTTGLLSEVIRYEKKLNLSPIFMYACWGKPFIGFIDCSDMLKNNGRIAYMDIPFGALAGFVDILQTQVGFDHKLKSFDSLDEGVRFCNDSLKNDKLVIARGTTYYLNFSPDYCTSEEKWREGLDANIDRKALSAGDGGAAHSFLMVDITDNGYLVYDSAFSYIGEIPKKDFYRAFTGLKGMKYLDGHPVQQITPPHQIYEIDFSNFKDIDIKDLGLYLLEKYIDSYMNLDKIDVEFDQKHYRANVGLGAVKEMCAAIESIGKYNDNHQEMVRFLADIFVDWEYKFIFFRDFIRELAAYTSISEEIIKGFEKGIEDFHNLSAKYKELKGIQFIESIGWVTAKLNEIYYELHKLFSDLRHTGC